MNEYVLITDSTADLPSDIVKSLEIKVLPLVCDVDGVRYSDADLDVKDFYNKLRNKSVASTSQINPACFEEYFEEYLKERKNVFYISFSSGLSGTYNSACAAAKSLGERYPDRQIKIVDSLSASLGEGMLVYLAALKKREELDIEELERWVTGNRLNVCHWFTVSDLDHLKRGGRISQTAAFLGGLMNIKPVLHVDNSGKLVVAEKARGQARAFETMISKMESSAKGFDNQIVFISHADCEKDAQNLAEKIKNKFKVKDIVINNIGTVIGSHTGANTLALFFLGSPR